MHDGILNKLESYENDALDFHETLALFAELIRTGMAWQLQGSYGRQARAYIDAELIDTAGNIAQPE